MRTYALLATLAETAVRAIALTRFDQRRKTERFEVDIREPHRAPFGSKTALSMEESHAGPACILSISGRISTGDAANLLERLNKLLLSGEKMIVLDFKGVLFLTSATFRVLLVASKEAEQNAARVALCGVLGQIRELFEMSGLLGVFNVHGTREEALAQLC
jgi:anti-anti-sigma factor